MAKSERAKLDKIDGKVGRVRYQFDAVATELTRLYEQEMILTELARDVSKMLEVHRGNIISGYVTNNIATIDEMQQRIQEILK